MTAIFLYPGYQAALGPDIAFLDRDHYVWLDFQTNQLYFRPPGASEADCLAMLPGTMPGTLIDGAKEHLFLNPPAGCAVAVSSADAEAPA